MVNFEEEIKQLIDGSIEEGYQRITQIATELQILEFLAKEHSNRNALGKCEMLNLTISSYMKEMEF